MFYFLIFSTLVITILLAFLVNFIHLSQYKFKKYLKFFIFLCLIGLIIFLLRYNPKIISILPLIFVLFFKWLPILKILKSIFLKTNYSDNFNNMSRKEAYDILGLKPDATKNDIIKRYNLLIKKNHPDVEGSEWISKKLNKARDILLG